MIIWRIYGRVKGDIDRDKYILGGCMVSRSNPSYYCANCKIDFDSNLNPVTALERVIIDFVDNDTFFVEILKRYFANDVKFDEKTAITLLIDVHKDEEIFNEFTKYLVKKSYDIENPIKIDGITAKDLAIKNPDKSAIEIYIILSKFKNK